MPTDAAEAGKTHEGSTPWRVLVVDDEAPARAKLRRFLEQVPDVGTILEARDGTAALQVLSDDRVDVVFLDIQMPGTNGLAVADALATLPQSAKSLVVFVTAHAEHAVQAFNLTALDYLLKPWDGDRFDITVDRIREAMRWRRDAAELAWRRQESNEHAATPLSDRFVVRDRGEHQLIPTRAVVWLEADGNHVHLHGMLRSWRTRGPLSALDMETDLRRFHRVSRSASVNLDAIVRIESLGHGDQLAHLAGGHTVRVSRRYRLPLP
jgi:two-component system, LytTR family, response regulator